MNYSRSDDGGSTLLTVNGQLDALTARELRPVLDSLGEASTVRAITVDLSALRLIDGSGVGALVRLYRRVRAHGGTVRIVGLAAQPLLIFKLLGLDRILAPR